MHVNAKKILKCLTAIVLTPIALFILLTVLLYIPPVQNWAVHKVTNYLSEKTGDDISVERIGLSFPLDLEISNMHMYHPNDSLKNVTDTVADVKTLVASVQLLPLFKGVVNVDELTFKDLKANTSNFIGDLRIKGDLRKLHVHSHGINLNSDSAHIDFAEIEGGYVDVALGDTVPEDTTKEKTLWKIDADKVSLASTKFMLHMPGDSMTVKADFHWALVNKLLLQLHDNIYRAGALDWHGGSLAYDIPYKPHERRGFDSNHISLDDINLGVDSFAYVNSAIQMKVRAANMTEQSGLTVNSLKGYFQMADNQIHLDNFHIIMPSTDIAGKYWMDMNAFDDEHPGRFFASVKGYVAKNDIRPLLTSIPSRTLNIIPREPLHVSGNLYGNLKYLKFKGLSLSFPSSLSVSGSGYIANVTDVDRLKANARLKLTTRNASFIKKFMPGDVARKLTIPRGLSIDGLFKINKTLYAGDFTAKLNRGGLKAKGFFNAGNNSYSAIANTWNFALSRFLPSIDAGPLTGRINIKGHGLEFPSNKTTITANARIKKFRFQNYILDRIDADVRLNRGRLAAIVNSHNPMASGRLHVNGRMNSKMLTANIRGNVVNANLRRLGVIDDPWNISVRPDLMVRTNLKGYYYAKGHLGNLSIVEHRRNRWRKLVDADLTIDGSMNGRKLTAKVGGTIDNANLQHLGIIDKPYFVSTVANANISGIMRKPYSFNGSIDANTFDMTERRDSVSIPLVSGNFLVNADVRGNNISGSFDGLIDNADLYQLGITNEPFKTGGNATIAFASDLKEKYFVKGKIDNMITSTGKDRYSVSDLNIDLLSDRDTTHAVVNGGDFNLAANLSGSYKTMLSAIDILSKEVKKQLDNKVIDQSALKAKLPTASLILKSGKGNILASLLAKNGIIFRNADIDLTSSPADGINGKANIDSLVYNNDITIDSLQLALQSADDRLQYDLAVMNNKANSYPYKGFINGTFFEKGLLTNVSILDSKDKQALGLGLKAAMEGDGILTTITSDRPVIGYKEFAVNDSNYIYIGKDRRLSADMKLLASDGAGAQIYTDDEDTTSLQNVTLGMHNFELGKLLAVLPMAPKISGTLNGDYHLIQTDKDLTVSSDMTVGDMIYDNCPMGDVGANIVYMPMSDSTHYVDAIISQNDNEVGQLSGTYNSTGKGSLDAEFDLNKFPLSFINGFVPDQIIGLDGKGEGALSVKGPLNNLDINGEVYLDSSYLFSEPYGLKMQFANDPVTIKDSRLLFENFEMYANNSQPLNVYGYLDFHDPSNMYVDARMRTENFEIIDAKENNRSTLYGKAFVNFMGGIRGYLDNLRMGGRLDLLGNTDMTYVMRDTPLSTDDQTENLVKFTNFNDTTADVIVRPTLKGFQMDLSIGIDEQAHVVAALNAQHSNYIDLIGGGDLTLHYDPTNDMTLRGRYTLNSGQMKYSLDMIPLRTFNIQEGSYIEFTGEPTNPTLNITATEDVKANYRGNGGNDRIVNFVAGVLLTNTLSKPGVEFIAEAPDDTEAQSDLNTKSAEERGKIAVTLLASGVYTSDGSGGNYAMSGALASFMQNQINSVTGRALSSMGLDITANMENSTDASGALHTDYTFNFSKRLWNNRLRIIMGGRVSTGANVGDDNGAYFDNFSVEYRLNKNETQYLKLYYDRQAYDWLEGNLSEFGAGFMWRRKLQHFKDIFRFKKKNTEVSPAPQRADSLIRFRSK